MMLYLKWGAVVLMLLVALFIGREYSAYMERRLAQMRGFSSLFSHAEEMISKYLSPADAIVSDFTDPELEKCGFLPALREGKDLLGAFEACSGQLALTSGMKREIGEFLSGFGRGYKDGELKRISAFRRRLEQEMASCAESAQKDVKAVRALLFGGAMAAGILII